MRFIENLCPPALLYLIFLVVHLGFDASLGMWATFVIKAILGIGFVVILDVFCGIELSIVSWFLVATPFLITALGTAISMGTSFDAIVLDGLITEKFMDKNAKEDDLPADSNIISN
jgi:hypothetical protein